jgi:hypothetical protein
MIKTNYILLILYCGFLLNPIDSYGCNSSEKNSSKKTCCELNKDSQQNNKVDKSCCKKTKSEPKSCDGSCANSNCNITPAFSSIIPFFAFNSSVTIETIVSKKVNFFYLEKNISTHYFSIWCPPKIS